jgi:hypothetical protein
MEWQESRSVPIAVAAKAGITEPVARIRKSKHYRLWVK